MATKCSTKVLIEAPVEDVWNVLVDVEAMPGWTDSIMSVRLLGGDELAVGSQVQISQPRMPTAVWHVDELAPLRRFRWVSTAVGVTTHGDHWIEPLMGGSRAEVRLEIRHTGPLASVIGALTMRRTRKYVTMEAQGLKARCEQAAAERSPEVPRRSRRVTPSKRPPGSTRVVGPSPATRSRLGRPSACPGPRID